MKINCKINKKTVKKVVKSERSRRLSKVIMFVFRHKGNISELVHDELLELGL